MNNKQFKDLVKLAHDRTRQSALSVAQLMDDDSEKAALLISCAVDFVEGAVAFVSDDGDSDDQEAMCNVLAMLFTMLGKDKILTMISMLQQKEAGK